MKIKNKIVENIKKELKERNKTVADLCKDMRVNKNFINQLTDRTNISKLKRISDAIGCDLASLFVGV